MTDATAIRIEALDYARNEGLFNKARHRIISAINFLQQKCAGIKSPSGTRAVLSFAAAVAIMSIIMLLTPHCAAAFGLDDLVNKVGDMISTWVDGILNAAFKVINTTFLQPR